MGATLRPLRSKAQLLARDKVPTSLRYPVAFHTTAVTLAPPALGYGGAVRPRRPGSAGRRRG
jgi:hypothetical protein